MTRAAGLRFGVWAAVVFAAGVIVLPWLVPGYDSIRQTVSEIGEVGSPMRWPFAAMLWAVALCTAGFATAVWRGARVAALCIAWMAIAATALGVFASPHPLHNVFGPTELIGYQAPLAFALARRRDPGARRAVRFSWVMYGLSVVSLALNLTALMRSGAVWDAIHPVYGIVQRSLFACFFVWTAGLGYLLSATTPSRSSPTTA